MDRVKINKLIRSKRKTLALEISRDAGLIVRAPKKAPLDYIEKIIQRKRLWILQKQEIARSKYKRFIPKEFVSGEGFLYLGNTYQLSIVNNNPDPLTFNSEFQLLKSYLPNARQAFINWYKKAAHWEIKQRLDWYSKASGLKYNKVNITSAMKRWGSCNTKAYLSFSWRLIMAPLKVVDYVVVHELAHVAIKNHSKNFWGKVKTIMPDYECARSWLRHNEFLLNL